MWLSADDRLAVSVAGSERGKILRAVLAFPAAVTVLDQAVAMAVTGRQP